MTKSPPLNRFGFLLLAALAACSSSVHNANIDSGQPLDVDANPLLPDSHPLQMVDSRPGPDAIVADAFIQNLDAGPTPGSCDPFGRFPVPTTSFEVGPADAASDDHGLYMPDVQARFPNVDWMHIDRFYIDAGTYSYIYIGNLPNRTADHPLIITNKGGQVHVGPTPTPTAGYLWIMTGGSNWILTGRYDPVSQTGDVNFPGHRCGAYDTARDHYGFLSDDEFNGFPTPMSHMGLVVNFDTLGPYEIEFLEIRRSTFAGIRLGVEDESNSPNTPLPLPNVDSVSVHDNYIHDTGGEGLYFGSTVGGVAHAKFTNLHVYNNRVLRTANEAMQLQDVGAGSHIDHNVFAWGAMNWRDAFEEDQDNCGQLEIREGPLEFDHNIWLGGREALGSYFDAPESTDNGGAVSFHDNYWSTGTWLALYLAGTGNASPASAPTTYSFTNNFFTDLDPVNNNDYGYFEAPYYPGDNRNEGTNLFQLGTFTSAITITGNQWSGTREFEYQPPNTETESNNTNSAVDPIVFNNTGYPDDIEFRALDLWTADNAPWTRNPTAGAMIY